MQPISRNLLMRVFNQLKANPCTYEMGAKADPLTTDSSTINQLDCSGWARYGIAKATEQGWVIPDGSDNQHSYFQSLADAGHIHKLANYSDVNYSAADPSRLFIAFIEPGAESEGSAGHVWLLMSDGARMLTLESHGANAHGDGIDQRLWDTPVLVNNCGGCYELPATD